MPTYQYACTGCGAQLETVQKFTDDPLTECAECGGRLRKVFSAVGVVFKGSGFYRTDSRASNGGAVATKSGDKSGEPAADKKADSSADSSTSAADSSSSSSSGAKDSSAPSSTSSKPSSAAKEKVA